ncbi:endonuclease/exonuclease/phosphatase family protein [Pedobacter frigoris]|uniref:Exonuclease III n=1 Tax=Pedobacter frigoris TaxID=2571272 RepID=A0A4U1CH34_9SPHI|nr:endonuclease/exonuclease/phosphatase family protein [Pedobacter frigoris]TKC06064.1 exonuclease III [Pedobacter frigoris]
MMKMIKKTLILFTALFSVGWSAFAQDPLRVLSYNILEGMKTDVTPGKQQFVQWVKDQDPDILALQEANKFTSETLAALAKSYGHDYSMIVKATGYPVALTSRFPITDVQKINENITHGFITATVNGYNIVVLHLNPHKYDVRRQEITTILAKIKANNTTKKLIVMGDFNSYSPLDQASHADGQLVQRFKDAKLKNAAHNNLVNGEGIDYEVQEKILDFGLIDILKHLADEEPANAKEIIPGKYRIDYIYVSKDLKKKLVRGKFIRDDFTKKYSDHLPLIIELKQN